MIRPEFEFELAPGAAASCSDEQQVLRLPEASGPARITTRKVYTGARLANSQQSHTRRTKGGHGRRDTQQRQCTRALGSAALSGERSLGRAYACSQ